MLHSCSHALSNPKILKIPAISKIKITLWSVLKVKPSYGWIKKDSWKHQCTDNLPSSAWYLFLSSPAYASKLCFGFHSTLFIAARQGIWWTVRPVWTFDCKRKKKKNTIHEPVLPLILFSQRKGREILGLP